MEWLYFGLVVFFAMTLAIIVSAGVIIAVLTWIVERSE